MRTVLIAGFAVCAAFAACSTDYDTIEVVPGSSSSSSSSGVGGAGGAGGGTGGGTGGASGGGGATAEGGSGGGGGGAPATGVHCGDAGAQCNDGQVCCHKSDAGDPNADFCSDARCPMDFGPIGCDEQSDCNNPSTICCATFEMNKLLDISCKTGCAFSGQAIVCSGGTMCPLGTCMPYPKFGAFYELCQ